MRGVIELLRIPIFNRISQLSYNFKDFNEIQLEREDLLRMPELELISVFKRSKERVNQSDVEAAGELVPPCRLDSMAAAADKITIKLNPRSVFACCAQN